MKWCDSNIISTMLVGMFLPMEWILSFWYVLIGKFRLEHSAVLGLCSRQWASWPAPQWHRLSGQNHIFSPKLPWWVAVPSRRGCAQTRTRAVIERNEGFLLTISKISPPLRLELVCIGAPDVSRMVKRIDRNAQIVPGGKCFPWKVMPWGFCGTSRGRPRLIEEWCRSDSFTTYPR